MPRDFSDQEVKMLADLGGLAERELEALELAVLDEGTGLINRRGLYTTGRNLVNDTYGHEADDRRICYSVGLAAYDESRHEDFSDLLKDANLRLAGLDGFGHLIGRCGLAPGQVWEVQLMLGTT